MNATELWNDHTFRVLLDDVFKARKDAVMGPMRLEVAMNYAASKLNVPPVETIQRNKMADLALEVSARPQVPGYVDEPLPGFAVDDDEPSEPEAPKAVKGTKKALGYVEQQRALRKNPNIELFKAADIVEAAIKKGGWDAGGNLRIPIPKGMSVVGLEAVLRERRLPFTSFMSSLPLKNETMDASLWKMSESAAEQISGAQGQKTTAGWVIVLSK